MREDLWLRDSQHHEEVTRTFREVVACKPAELEVPPHKEEQTFIAPTQVGKPSEEASLT